VSNQTSVPRFMSGPRECLLGPSPKECRRLRGHLAISIAIFVASYAQEARIPTSDRDAIFGTDFRDQVRDMGIREVLSAPRSPWQRAYIERVIGSIRRECLDHVIVFQESSLRHILVSYLDYYHRSRTHLSLGKDSPEPRGIQPPGMGSVVALPQVGGLHHRYERRVA
jgi:transposase InsO family protein